MNYKFLTIAALGVAFSLSATAKNEFARKAAESVTATVQADVTKVTSEPKEDAIVPAPTAKGNMISEWEWTDAKPDPGLTKLNRSLQNAAGLNFWKMPVKRAPGKARYGTIIPKDYDVRGTMNYLAMELVHGENADSIINMGTSGSSIVINIDEAAGTVSIAPQVVLKHNTYGNVYVYPCSVKDGKLVYNENADVKGTIDTNGKITLEGWGFFVGQGENKGGWFVANTRSEWIPANSKVVLNNADGTATQFNALIEQPYDNEITIFNLAGYANPIMATMGVDKNIRISPQLVYTNSMFGPFFNYAAVESQPGKYSIQTDTYTTAIGTDNKIKTDAWVIAARLAPTTYVARIVNNAIITTEVTLRYPKTIAGNFEGSGSQADPYKVKTAEDLAKLAQRVASDDFKGKFFRLENNIDLGNTASRFMPVGDLGTPFEGTFDGNGKTISGLRLDARGDNYVGLFGNLGANGKVMNLNIDNFILQSNGAWISPLVADNLGTISNCKVTKSRVISNGQSAGGIAGRSAGTVEDCSFSGEIIGVGNIAGIVGYNYSKIYRSHSDAALQRAGHVTDIYRDIAGIAGTSASSEGYEARIEDCYFEGSINEASGYGIAGGIVGKMVNSSMIRSFNVGSISHMREDADYDNYTGGVAAYVRSSNIGDCYNAGTIVKSSSKGLASEGAGGVVGYISVRYSSTNGGPMVMSDKSKIRNCFNTGQVVSSSPESHKNVWGMTFTYEGQDPIPETFENCWFDSQISGFSDATFGKNTSDVTKSTLPSGYSTDIWTASAGLYPVLKLQKGTKASNLASSVPMFAGNEDVRKVKKAFSLSSPDGILWKFYSSTSSNFVDETQSLKISGKNVSLKDQYGNDLLVALTDDGVSMKLYRIAPVPHLFDGEGTQSDPYLVKTAADFKTLDTAVGTYGQSHIGDYFKMANDIDFKSAPEFQGVGAKKGTSVSFGATFDGDGHSIHNLNIAATQIGEDGDGILGTFYNYAGLFSVANKYSTIKNLNIASDCKFLGYTSVGAITGYTEGRIENCRNYSEVKGARQNAGGITGSLGSTGVISGCYNSGFVAIGYSGAGGICGTNRGLIELSQNDGEISGERANGARLTQGLVGGITGSNVGSIDRCVNNANIGSATQVGGITGNNSNINDGGNISRSVNNGIVIARTEVSSRGGIAGTMGSFGTLTDNYYDASVNINGAANNTGAVGMNGISTSELTSGNQLKNLDSKEWSFKKGAYPVLAKFAEEPLAVSLRSIYVNFIPGQSRANVTKDLDLAPDTKITWSLKQNKDFKVADGKLKITVPTGMTMASDTLTASLNGLSKVFCINSVPTIFKGDGTLDNPYLIETVEDMTKLAAFMDTTKFEYGGFNFKLVNDLDYSGKEFRVIAPVNVKFMASFDGNGKTISNYNFSNTSTKTGEGRYIGLFGIIGETGHVKNLTVNGTFEGNSYIGGVAGDLYGQISNCVHKGIITGSSTSSAGIAGIASRVFAGAVVRDCRNEGTIDSKGTVNGGIVATLKAGGLIENCVNDGIVMTSSIKAGGIAAETYGAIRKCVNKKPVIGKSSVAGITVDAYADATEISDCINEADIKATDVTSGQTIAGIVCRTAVQEVNNVVVRNCINRGNITGKGYTAGIINYIYQGARVENCVNYGTVENTGTGYSGGIVSTLQGKTNVPGYLINCHNEGAVKAHWSYSGGVAGQIIADGYAEDCYNLGEVTLTGYNGKAIANKANTIAFGGFAGCIRGVAVNCWNAGNVTTEYSTVGGFTGILQSSAGHLVMDKCFNLGHVKAANTVDAYSSYGGPGGLVGYSLGFPEMQNCYNMGTVEGPKYVGGLIGKVNKTCTKLTNCYNAGKIIVPEDNSNWGNIAYTPNGASTLALVNSYYDKDVTGRTTSFDQPNTGLTTAELYTGADLGEAYHISRGAYPVIASTAEPAYAHYAAAGYEFWNTADKETNLTDNLYIGNHGAEKWTASEHFVIENGIAFPAKLGEGTLTLTSPDGTKREFKFNITKVSGVDSIGTEKEIVSRRYIDMQGRNITEPVRGQIYLIRTQYDDGTFDVVKRVFTD